jgi:uncharacterized Rossmann fold enzyme
MSFYYSKDVANWLFSAYREAILDFTKELTLANEVKVALKEFVDATKTNQMFYKYAQMFALQVSEDKINHTLEEELKQLFQESVLVNLYKPIAKTMIENARKKAVIAPCKACEKYVEMSKLADFSCSKANTRVNSTVKLVETFVENLFRKKV